MLGFFGAGDFLAVVPAAFGVADAAFGVAAAARAFAGPVAVVAVVAVRGRRSGLAGPGISAGIGSGSALRTGVVSTAAS
ncbi:MAG TPA: hypothetical protein VLK30_00740, partial [Candidatus Limnocylindrales bacterium]|nr:hypothetical protein [Candidatus Limnocylindrales bacterium]